MNKYIGPYQITRSLPDSNYEVAYEGVTLNIKVINSEALQTSLSEINLSMSIEHPNIVKYHQLLTINEDLIIVSEFNSYRLSSILGLLTKKQIITYIHSIASALSFLHCRMHYTHGNISASNIAVINGRAILADFSYAYRYTVGDRMISITEERYRSPESYNGPVNAKLSDIWSFGILSLLICCNMTEENYDSILLTRYESDHNLRLAEELNSRNRVEVLQDIFDVIDSDISDLFNYVSYMLNPNIKYRLNDLSQLLYSSFYISRYMYPIGGLIKNREPSITMYSVQQTNKAIKIIMSACYYSKLNIGTCYLALEMFYQSYRYIVSEIDMLNTYAAICVWLSAGLNKEESKFPYRGIYDWGNFESESIHNILDIIYKEQGKINYRTCFDLLPSKQLLLKAMRILLDMETYSRYGNSEVLSVMLMEDETQDEIEKRKDKYKLNYEDFNFSYVMYDEM